MSRLRGIKAIAFDMDGTLWDFDAAMRRALGKTLLELQRFEPEAAATLDVDRVVAIRERVENKLRGVVSDLNEIRLGSFKQVLREIGRPDDALASRLCDVYLTHQSAGKKLFDDVLPTLDALKHRYTLGLVSNGNSYAEHFGLEGLIGFAVYAQDHGGVQKPDPALFHIALNEAGCSARELVHVGDSLEIDVAGARNAGVKSVWLNRNGSGARPDITPDAEIASLRELGQIL